MRTTTPSLLDLTAADLMSRVPVLIPEGMSVRGAARLLAVADVSGAPVVDEAGRCVGVLSATDFVRLAQNGHARPAAVRCDPPCPVCDWQLVSADVLPAEAVRDHMTSDPVTARPDTPLGELARIMRDADVHRVIIVVDEGLRPVGVVSGTDIVAAVARAGRPRPSTR